MLRVGLSLGLALLVGALAFAEDEAPKPGPEHEFLKKFAGNWECTLKASFIPGQPASESKGVETSKVALGGFFVIGDFKGEMMGMPFEGHSIKGYDTFKKKFTSVWADSMGSWIMMSEGTLDKSGKVLTEVAEGPDMTGKTTKYIMKTEFKDNDNMVFNMAMPNEQGKEVNVLTITYKRKK